MKSERVLAAPGALAALLIASFFAPPPVHASTGTYVQNPDFELASSAGTPLYWLKGVWGSNTATFSYPVPGRSGSAARVSMSSHTTGDAKWYFPHVTASPGEVFYFSDYYRSNVDTVLTAQFKHADGSYSYHDLAFLPPSSDWAHASAVVSLPEGAESFTVFHLINRQGWLEVDDYSLRFAHSAEGRCPVRAEEGVIVAEFSERLRADLGDPYEREILSFPLPAGKYDVTLITDDHYPGRSAFTQTNETWFLKIAKDNTLLATTAPTTDLQDGVEAATSTDLVAEGLVLGSGAHTLIAQHAAPIDHSAPNSLNPLCAVFEDTAHREEHENKISNPDAELSDPWYNPLGWGKGRWGVNSPVFTYIDSAFSGKGLRVDMNACTSGDAKWHFAHVPVLPGTTYRFSDRYRSDVPTTLTAQYKKSDGTFTYQDLALVPPASSWTSAEVIFTPPAGVVSATIFHLINAVGWLETDSYFLGAQ